MEVPERTDEGWTRHTARPTESLSVEELGLQLSVDEIYAGIDLVLP